MSILSLLAAGLSLAQPTPPVLGQRTQPAAAMLPDLGPNAGEDPAIAAAASFPLGSKENPVRVGGPTGEQAYLARLRCANGSAPRIGARSEQGVGAFGSVVAGYALECSGSPASVLIMDMYHDGHIENRAPSGFTVFPG